MEREKAAFGISPCLPRPRPLRPRRSLLLPPRLHPGPPDAIRGVKRRRHPLTSRRKPRTTMVVVLVATTRGTLLASPHPDTEATLVLIVVVVIPRDNSRRRIAGRYPIKTPLPRAEPRETRRSIRNYPRNLAK